MTNNLKSIKKKNELEMELTKLIKSQKPMHDIELEEVFDSNHLNFMIKTGESVAYLHSLYNIERECKMMINSVEADTEVLIVFGFGCGYLLDYVEQHLKNIDTIIFIEPTTQILEESILRESVVNRLQSKNKLRISFILNRQKDALINDLTRMVVPILKRKIGFVYQLTYRSIFSDVFDIVNKELKISLQRQQLSIGTTLTNLYLNLVDNISSLKYKTLNFEDVIDKFEGLPFILVSAGPSLNKNMHILKEMKNKAVIIAAGSAIKILHNNGIEPHFRMALSPDKDEKKVFIDIDKSKIPLFFSGTVYYEALVDYIAPKIRVVGNNSTVIQYLYKKINDNYLIIDGGYTVANATLGLMCKCKASHIIMIGQDLSYKDGQFYAKGSWTNEIYNTEGEKFIKVKDIYGNDVATQQLYIFTKEDFERQIKNSPDIKFYNATEGGLNIENAENIELKKLVEKFEDNNKINQIFDYIDSYEIKNIVNKRHEDKISIIKSIIEEISDLIIINEKRIEKLKKIQDLFERKVSNNRISNEIDYIMKFTDEFNEVEYYKNVVEKELKELFKIISLSIQYFGDDLLKTLETKQKYHLAVSYEIKKYLEISKALYEDVLKLKE